MRRSVARPATFGLPRSQAVEAADGDMGAGARVTLWILPLMLLAAFAALAIFSHLGPVRGETRVDVALTRRAPLALTYLSQSVDALPWAVFTLAAAGILGLASRWRAALLLIVGDISAETLSALGKIFINRHPPGYGFPLSDWTLRLAHDMFPSGHITRATVVVGLLVALLAWPHRGIRWPAVVLAVAFLAVLGVTQAAVGGHLPLDVIGGYLLGSGWLTILVLVAGRWARRRRQSKRLGATPVVVPRASSG